MRLLPLLSGLAVATALAGCDTSPKAPFDTGVCYAVTSPDGKIAFNVVARDQPQIEFCAARLEEMRLNFLRLGGNKQEVMGSYQGRYIFVDRRGVSYSQTLDGVRFFALARTGDGRLAVPGAIERDIQTLGVVEEPAVVAPPAG